MYSIILSTKVLYKCSLQNKHSKKGNKHETIPEFIAGALKIQNGLERTLTPDEQTACHYLKKENHPFFKKKAAAAAAAGESDDDDDEEPIIMSPAVTDFDMAAILDDAVQDLEDNIRERDSEYINCDFLLGSAAIVECLWSKLDALIPQRRSGMSPIMVEAILYLKENRDLWSIEDVKEALRRVKANEKSERTKKKMKAHQMEELQVAAEALNLGAQEQSGVVDYEE